MRKRNNKYPVLIMAGGTGGHIFPALAVARNLQDLGISVVWVGTRDGLESRLIPAAGIPIKWIRVSGLRGKGLFKRLISIFSIALASVQVLIIFVIIKPRLVLGMGGFVSGPGGMMAKLLGKPLIIHEQNAVPGFTNRILSRVATVVLEAFPNTFHTDRLPLCTGNPVRQDIVMLSAPAVRYANRKGGLNILVLGGSQGARVLNEIVPEALKILPAGLRPNIWHQVGRASPAEDIADAYSKLEIDARVDLFIENMAEAYAWSDLVIARSGAMTVAEISVAGIASILIPFPHAVDDHQTANARYLADAGAAVLIQQAELSVECLSDLISALSVDRARVINMAQQAHTLGKPAATDAVVNQCLIIADELNLV